MIGIIKTLFGGMRNFIPSSHKPHAGPRRARPAVECLEGRALPSTVLPTVEAGAVVSHVKVFDGGGQVALGDGSVRFLSDSVSGGAWAGTHGGGGAGKVSMHDISFAFSRAAVDDLALTTAPGFGNDLSKGPWSLIVEDQAAR
jgi:hypothetical protein